MSKSIGVLGVLAVFAGLRLLWQARREIFFWLEAFVRVLREQLAGTGAPPRSLRLLPETPGGRNTLRIAVGIFLVLLGPALIALGLVL